MSDRDDEPIESPPEGATCGEHPERPAAVVCPRCGSYACLGCWHMTVKRCHACLMRDPLSAAPPIAWENEKLGPLGRFFGTIGSAVRPGATAPAFARGEVRPAVIFALLSFVPLALIEGIVPITHTLAFGDRFGVRLVGTPSPVEIAIDVVRAIGLGLGIAVVRSLVLAVPYYSLARAYSNQGHPAAPVRVMLYRLWLIPLSGVLFNTMEWGLPADAGQGAITLLLVLQVLPYLFLLSSMLSSARMASGVGPFAAIAVAIVPFALFFLVQGLIGWVVAPFMPDPEAVRQAIAH